MVSKAIEQRRCSVNSQTNLKHNISKTNWLPCFTLVIVAFGIGAVLTVWFNVFLPCKKHMKRSQKSQNNHDMIGSLPIVVWWTINLLCWACIGLFCIELNVSTWSSNKISIVLNWQFESVWTCLAWRLMLLLLDAHIQKHLKRNAYALLGKENESYGIWGYCFAALKETQ